MPAYRKSVWLGISIFRRCNSNRLRIQFGRTCSSLKGTEPRGAPHMKQQSPFAMSEMNLSTLKKIILPLRSNTDLSGVTRNIMLAWSLGKRVYGFLRLRVGRVTGRERFLRQIAIRIGNRGLRSACAACRSLKYGR